MIIILGGVILENNIKVKASLSCIKSGAKYLVNLVKSQPNWSELTPEDIESMKFDFEGMEKCMGLKLPEGGSNFNVGDFFKYVSDLAVARLYLDKCNVKHVTERLRPGFIGMETKNGNVVSQQVSRGAPYGTIVSIPGINGKATIGVSYYDEIGKFATPIRSEYEALKDAIKNKDSGCNGLPKERVRPEAKAQVDHFYKRSLAYWNPDVYSHSRGSEPVVYKNYDKIHENQTKILGEQKMKSFSTRISKDEVLRLKNHGNVTKKNIFGIGSAATYEEYDFLTVDDDDIVINNDVLPTKNKGKLCPSKGDWLVFVRGRWETLYMSEPKTSRAVNRILNNYVGE